MSSGITRQWEFALSEPGYEIRYDRTLACPGCGAAHQRVFLETDWDDDETEHPDRAIVLTVLQAEQGVMVYADHFEHGVRQVRAVFQVEDLQEFIRNSANDVAEGLRALRRVSLQRHVERSEDRAAACIN